MKAHCDLTEQYSPPNLSTPLHVLLSAKQAEEASLENLIGVTQKATSLKISKTPKAYSIHRQPWCTEGQS